MKNYNDIAKSVLSRRDEFDEAQKTKRKKAIRSSAFAACLVVVAVLCAGVFQGDLFDEKPLQLSSPSSQEESHGEVNKNSTTLHSENKTSQKETTTQTTAPTSENPTSHQNTAGATDGGSFHSSITDGWFIPLLPFDREIKITGEAITDSQAQEYFELHKESIIGSLSSSGVSSDEIKISPKGYCHVNYDGVEGKSFELRQNYRDYLVYNGDELAAIITLYKENGEIYNTPSFGAKWFDDYNSYLKKHKDEKLVYAYASGWVEIIIAPDNTYFNPMGIDLKPYLDGTDKPYEMFYHESATYIP